MGKWTQKAKRFTTRIMYPNPIEFHFSVFALSAAMGFSHHKETKLQSPQKHNMEVI